jgi:dipeptidyl aminopeptidase/acylaminoacyl peptidase
VEDKIHFGGYDWRVLAVQGSTTLMVTDKIIEQLSYHNNYVPITWADCSLREYLNTEFYDRFSNAEKARIIPVINKNPDNPWFNTLGGCDTEDKVFILSLEEIACKYFGDSSALLYNPRKNQRYWYERKDANNSKRIAKDEAKNFWWYWIRTPGRFGVKAVYVFPDGNIGIHGNNIKIGNVAEGFCAGGVRPARWVSME